MLPTRYRTFVRPTQRRAAIIVKVAILIPVIGGMTAIGVDLVYLHSARADLQRAADAAALAVARSIGDVSPVQDPYTQAMMLAQEMVNANPIGPGPVQLGGGDVVLGRATYTPDANGVGTFEWVGPVDSGFNAVQITLRRTNDSPSGPVPMFFGFLLGRESAEITAVARAAIVPRDIALVCDLSGSMNDDSELRHYATANINLREIWAALGNPTYGKMTTWGTDPIPSGYDPTADSALLLLAHNTTFNDALVSPLLIAQGYTLAERNAIRKFSIFPNTDVPLPGAPTYSSPNWINRTAAVLGLAQWHSGKSGGAFPGPGQGPGTPNGDNKVEDHEMVWVVPYPFAGGSWQEWIGTFMAMPPPGTAMVTANINFRYRFGLKTFVNYLLEKRSANAETDALWQTPERPLKAVKDAVGEMVAVLNSLGAFDQLSLDVFGTTAHTETTLTQTYDTVTSIFNQRQSNHYGDPETCIGCGISYGRSTLLNAPTARPEAQRVMVLLTDGLANVDGAGTYYNPVPDPNPAAAYAESEAQITADAGISIYTIAVGAEADNAAVVELMTNIANIGNGEFYAATGSVEEYTAQLAEIFRNIAGDCRAVLIP